MGNATVRTLTASLLSELYSQESGDPFLMLLTLSHPSFTTLRLVNNTVDITSNGNFFMAFPIKINLPVDDGQTQREVTLELDNVSLEFLDELRLVTTAIGVKIEMVLASNPDIVQISLEDLKIRGIQYDKQKITAKLYMDDFMSTSVTSEIYGPSIYPGIF